MDGSTEVHPPPLDPADALRAARGFSAMFWGLVISFAGLARLVTLPFDWAHRIPPHTPGILVALVGAWWLLRATTFPSSWRATARVLAISTIILACLLPVFHWWSAIAHTAYLAFNVLLFAGALLSFAVAAHRIGIATGRALADDVLVAEGRICAWIAPALLLLSLALSGIRTVWVLFYVGIEWEVILATLGTTVRPAALSAVLLPMIPCLAMLWESKERCLARLARGGDPPAVPPAVR